MEELWHPVPGWENLYEVSSLGRVRSLDRVIPHSKKGIAAIKGKLLKPWKNGKGYLTVELSRLTDFESRGPKKKRYMIHTLVAIAFIGPRPAGKNVHVLHGAGGKMDNSLSNLRYGTASENEKDKERDGTSNRGTRNRTARLTEDNVIDIRRRIDAGEPPSALAREYGVAVPTIFCIKARRTWAWLDAL